MRTNECSFHGQRRLLLLSGLITLLMAAAGCGGSSGGSSSTSSPGTWTFMVYMAADNNLSDAGIGDINEMEQTGSTNAVNVVVQAEFSQDYSGEDVSDETVRGRIIEDSSTKSISSMLSEIGNKDMSDPDTLAEFIQWAADTYPADHYTLVLWDHGDGWKAYPEDATPYKGALQDDTSSGSMMSLPDIASAIRLSGVHFDLINFDACYMGMYEIAYELSDLADYLVFSEEVTPSDGDPYNTILAHLTGDPSMTGRELAALTAAEYISFYQGQDRTIATKSAVDTAQIALLHSQLAELAGLITAGIGTERTALQFARDNSLTCKNRPTYHDLKDVLDTLYAASSSAVIKGKISEIQVTLAAAITANGIYSYNASDTIFDLGGLSIYMPRRSQVTDEELSHYDLLACNRDGTSAGDTWADLIDLLIAYDEESGEDALPTGTGGFTVWLQWDTDADLDLIIWEPDGTLSAPYTSTSSANGFFSADSATSGVSAEYFCAFDDVASGPYDILVNYYEDGTSQGATASLYFMDPNLGMTELTLLDEFYLDLSSPAPSDWLQDDAEQLNVWNDVYSDWFWWYNEVLLYRSTSVSSYPVTFIGGKGSSIPAGKIPSSPEDGKSTPISMRK
ncbi:MAG TPA: clostripain-related cysteine peptidase [Deltaproteobacteria bacterium]|nr:clostripain-related cysteine peptidase [Deltaproteobacteria bacterium]